MKLFSLLHPQGMKVNALACVGRLTLTLTPTQRPSSTSPRPKIGLIYLIQFYFLYILFYYLVDLNPNIFFTSIT